MRALKLKIELECMRTDRWDMWKRADQDFILKCASDCHVECDYDPKYDEMIFTGKPQDLYFFLHAVAYRYDIEIM